MLVVVIFDDFVDRDAQKAHLAKEFGQVAVDEFAFAHFFSRRSGLGAHEVAYPSAVVDDFPALKVVERACYGVGVYLYGGCIFAHRRYAPFFGIYLLQNLVHYAVRDLGCGLLVRDGIVCNSAKC